MWKVLRQGGVEDTAATDHDMPRAPSQWTLGGRRVAEFFVGVYGLEIVSLPLRGLRDAVSFFCVGCGVYIECSVG